MTISPKFLSLLSRILTCKSNVRNKKDYTKILKKGDICLIQGKFFLCGII